MFWFVGVVVSLLVFIIARSRKNDGSDLRIDLRPERSAEVQSETPSPSKHETIDQKETTAEAARGSKVQLAEISLGQIATTRKSLQQWLPESFVVFDLETTGLSAAKCDIIEIGAIKIKLNETNYDNFQVLVKPGTKVTKLITSITGISNDMLAREGIQLHDALREFAQFREDLPIVSYNAAFDMAFLKRHSRQCGMSFTNRYACALLQARKAYPELANHKLPTVAKHISASCVQHHRALADSVLAAQVFLAATADVGTKIQWTSQRMLVN